jgi:hypothetical protein
MVPSQSTAYCAVIVLLTRLRNYRGNQQPSHWGRAVVRDGFDLSHADPMLETGRLVLRS